MQFVSIPELNAESFGFSESKVKVTLSRLRAQLKKHLESEGYSV